MRILQLSLIALTIFGLISTNLFSQESKPGKVKELYLNGNLLTFNNFGLQYKSELNNGNFFRIGWVNFYTGFSNLKDGTSPQYNSSDFHFNGDFEIGLEKRKQISERLTFFYGINFLTMTSFNIHKKEDPGMPLDQRSLNDLNLSPGIGFDTGLMFKITGDFSIAAEIMPALLFNYASREEISGTETVKDTQTGVSLDFNTQSVLISLVYRWNKM